METWYAQAFMCSVIELEIALYFNLTANFYSPSRFSFTAFISCSLISLSSLPSSLVSLCTWKRQACLVAGYEYSSPASLLLFVPGLLRACPLIYPPLLLPLLNPSFVLQLSTSPSVSSVYWRRPLTLFLSFCVLYVLEHIKARTS